MTRLQHGFNIIELMVIVAIVGIVTAISNPSYQSFIRNQAISAVSTEIVATLQAARSEAIKRSVLVKVCFKKEEIDVNCEDPGITTSEINYIYVFIDDKDAVPNNQLDLPDEELILLSKRFSRKVSLRQIQGNNLGGSIEFDQKGGASFQATDDRLATYIAICDDRGLDGFGRQITISPTGRATLSAIANSSLVTCVETDI